MSELFEPICVWRNDERIEMSELLDEIVPHVVRENSRYHVIWWDALGQHCSEPECEINQGGGR